MSLLLSDDAKLLVQRVLDYIEECERRGVPREESAELRNQAGLVLQQAYNAPPGGTHTMSDTIISDEEVAALNHARGILESYVARCNDAARESSLGYNGGEANALDYAKVSVWADNAADAIFTVLNWTSSHRVRPLTSQQVHGKTLDDAA